MSSSVEEATSLRMRFDPLLFWCAMRMRSDGRQLWMPLAAVGLLMISPCAPADNSTTLPASSGVAKNRGPDCTTAPEASHAAEIKQRKMLCNYFRDAEDCNWTPPTPKPRCTAGSPSKLKHQRVQAPVEALPLSTDGKNDMSLVISALFSKMKPGQSGYCARAVNDALAAAGTKIPVRPHAYQMGWFLEQAGFHTLPPGSYTPSEFRRGDIIIFQPIAPYPKDDPKHPGDEGHQWGHIAVYDDQSQSWLSDFRQKYFNTDRYGRYNFDLYTIYRK